MAIRTRFTIRDLVWLTLVVALTVGWWIEHSRQSQFQQWIVTDQNGKIAITDRDGHIAEVAPGGIVIAGNGLHWRHLRSF